MMTFQSDLKPLLQKELGDYEVHRLRYAAYEAVLSLWRIREAAGLKQKDIADRLGCNPAWVSRSLRGPGNWTLRTFGHLIAALDGDVELKVHPMESPLETPANYRRKG